MEKKNNYDDCLPETGESILFKTAPVLRGAVAEPSGNEDDPYRRTLLRFYTDENSRNYIETEQAKSFKSCPLPQNICHKPPLQLPHFCSVDSVRLIKEKTIHAVKEYEKEYGFKPGIIYLPGVGIIEVRDCDSRANETLNNKVALVTGSAGAIGSGICAALVKNGYLVAAGDLPGERLDGFVKELHKTAPGQVIGVPVDVTDGDSVKAAFDRVVSEWGGVDIVIINAGIAMVASLMEMDPEAFCQQEKVNIEGTLLTLAEAGRRLSLQGTGGDIVLISTKNVFAPGAQFGAYSATKAAAHQLCRIASQEYAEEDIRVNMVSPDAVFSHGHRKSGLWEKVGPDRMRRRGLDEKGLEDYYRNRNLLKARVTANHVANAVLFFITRQTPTTGATIPVDGGLPDATPR